MTPLQMVVASLVSINAILYCPIAPSRSQRELHDELQGAGRAGQGWRWQVGIWE